MSSGRRMSTGKTSRTQVVRSYGSTPETSRQTTMNPVIMYFRFWLIVGQGAASAQNRTGDDHALDLRSAFADLAQPRVAVQAFDAVIAEISGAAMNLHGLVGGAL